MRPNLIITDLNMPKMDGRELLLNLKNSDEFSIIPIIVFSTSGYELDIKQSYSAGANAYIQKPIVIDEYLDIIYKISEFWLTIVKYSN